MIHKVIIDTTVKGGLPVTAQAIVHSCSYLEYPGANYLEQLEISFLNGYPFEMELSKADDDKVCEEIFAAFNEGRAGHII